MEEEAQIPEEEERDVQAETWSREDWDEWRRQQQAWWYDSETAWHDDTGEDSEICWEQFDHGNEQILPEEILGWLLLRRSGLPASARLSVLSAINNQLDFSTVERAMRHQEEELLMAESHKHFGPFHKQRRSYWVEQDGQWGLMNESNLEDEIAEAEIIWVGDQLPAEVFRYIKQYLTSTRRGLHGCQMGVNFIGNGPRTISMRQTLMDVCGHGRRQSRG